MPRVRFTKETKLGGLTYGMGATADLTDEQAKQVGESAEPLVRVRFAKDWTDGGVGYPAQFEYHLPAAQAQRAHAAGVVNVEGSDKVPEAKAEAAAEHEARPARARPRAEG